MVPSSPFSNLNPKPSHFSPPSYLSSQGIDLIVRGRRKKTKCTALSFVDIYLKLIVKVDAFVKEEEHARMTDSVVTEVNDISDNAVFRKFLRVPMYFDPVDKNSEACFNCGEEVHTAADCTMERRNKPCFVCGMFGHFAKHCTQGQDCFTCKRRGHIAKNCPEKHQRTPRDSVICL